MRTAGSRPGKRRILLICTICLALAAAAALLLLLRPAPPAPQAAEIWLDGALWKPGDPVPAGGEKLRVYVTLDGEPLIDLPFEQAHTLRIVQPDRGENTVTLTGSAVRMTEADCEGQDCVEMGEVTAENLELRVMGGFIICLPHRLSVEVRGRD